MKKLFLLSLLVMSINFSYSQTLTDGLVAFYQFEGSAEDVSTNNYDGTVVGATSTTDRFGNENSAYSFDGVDDYIEVLHNIDFDFTANSEYTICSWIKIHDDSWGIIYEKGSKSNNTSLSLETGNFKGDATNEIYVGRRYKENNYVLTDSTSTSKINLTNDIFYNVSAVYKPEGVEFYLNGLLINYEPRDITGKEIINTNNLMIGCSGNSDTFFNGVIDDIMIYNRALSYEEITEVYKIPNLHEIPDYVYILDFVESNKDITTKSETIKSVSNNITLYPTTASDETTISIPNYNEINSGKIIVKNILGQTVYQTNVNQSETIINVSTFVNGTYIFNIIDSAGGVIGTNIFTKK